MFTQLFGATAEETQTMGPCYPLSEWGEEWRPLDMATWSLNAPTSPSWKGQSENERKLELRKRENSEMKMEGEERRYDITEEKR